MNNLTLETIKQQCNTLIDQGVEVKFSFTRTRPNMVSVIVKVNNKQYRFSDPNPNVIISQLNILTRKLLNA